jgi:hypothetical protein
MAAASPLDSEQTAASPIPQRHSGPRIGRTCPQLGRAGGRFSPAAFSPNQAAKAASLQLHLSKQNQHKQHAQAQRPTCLQHAKHSHQIHSQALWPYPSPPRRPWNNPLLTFLRVSSITSNALSLHKGHTGMAAASPVDSEQTAANPIPANRWQFFSRAQHHNHPVKECPLNTWQQTCQNAHLLFTCRNTTTASARLRTHTVCQRNAGQNPSSWLRLS